MPCLAYQQGGWESRSALFWWMRYDPHALRAVLMRGQVQATLLCNLASGRETFWSLPDVIILAPAGWSGVGQASIQWHIRQWSRKRTMMDPPEVAVARFAAKISEWALFLSGGSLLIAACAFVLELRRWFDEGVKLSMNMMPGAILVGGGVKDPNRYLHITVANRGTSATTVTHMVLYNYPTRLSLFLSRLPLSLFKRPRFLWRWFERHGAETFIVKTDQVPHVLESGRTWQGRATQSPDIDKMIMGGRLYVGIIGSHSSKPFIRRVRGWSPPKDAKVA
jgi:hypothetical protein